MIADSILRLDVQQDDPGTNFDLEIMLRDFNVVEDEDSVFDWMYSRMILA